MLPVSLLSLMIVGMFRDNGGSYDGYYRMLGALSLAAAALFATQELCGRKNPSAESEKVERNVKP
ncbi:uncharacterized protein LOC144121809 [Amblyomma americanum]